MPCAQSQGWAGPPRLGATPGSSVAKIAARDRIRPVIVVNKRAAFWADMGFYLSICMIYIYTCIYLYLYIYIYMYMGHILGGPTTHARSMPFWLTSNVDRGHGQHLQVYYTGLVFGIAI